MTAAWLPGDRPATLPKGHPGFVYAQDECGCIMLSLVNEPSEVRHAKNDIARQVMRGRDIRHAPFGGLPPWYCDEHRSSSKRPRERLDKIDQER